MGIKQEPKVLPEYKDGAVTPVLVRVGHCLGIHSFRSLPRPTPDFGRAQFEYRGEG